jgi:hypothetical protein
MDESPVGAVRAKPKSSINGVRPRQKGEADVFTPPAHRRVRRRAQLKM